MTQFVIDLIEDPNDFLGQLPVFQSAIISHVRPPVIINEVSDLCSDSRLSAFIRG